MAPTLKICSIHMRFDPETLPQALGLLQAAVGPIQVKRGCRVCRVKQDTMEEGLVHYREEWASEAAFKSHLRSDHFWSVLMAMDPSTKRPRVAIGNLTAWKGLEHLLALRKPTADANGTDAWS
jgi:quinol monooxygenase YgiN